MNVLNTCDSEINAINAINDINDKIKQNQNHKQDPIQLHEIRDPYGILPFLELRRSRL